MTAMLPAQPIAPIEPPIRIWPWAVVAGLCLIMAMIIMDECRPLVRLLQPYVTFWQSRSAAWWVVIGSLWNGLLIILAPLIMLGLLSQLPPRSRRTWLGFLASLMAGLLFGLPGLLRLASPLLTSASMQAGWPALIDPLAGLIGQPAQVGRLLTTLVPAWLEMGPLIGIAVTAMICRWSTGMNGLANRGLVSLPFILGLSAAHFPWWMDASIIVPYQAIGAAWLTLGAVTLAHTVRTTDWRPHVGFGLFALALIESRRFWDVRLDLSRLTAHEIMIGIAFPIPFCVVAVVLGWYLARGARLSAHRTEPRVQVWMVATGYYLVATSLYSLPSDDSTLTAFITSAFSLLVISALAALARRLSWFRQLRRRMASTEPSREL